CVYFLCGRLDLTLLRHQNGALDNMIQLADVALPRIVEQQLHSRVIETADAFTIPLGVSGKKVRRQQGNIFAALAQRRNMDLNGVQPEQKVLPKSSALYL